MAVAACVLFLCLLAQASAVGTKVAPSGFNLDVESNFTASAFS
jgi:hypothetical protein